MRAYMYYKEQSPIMDTPNEQANCDLSYIEEGVPVEIYSARTGTRTNYMCAAADDRYALLVRIN